MFESTQIGTTNYDQGGVRLDHYFGVNDQLFVRYSTSACTSSIRCPSPARTFPAFR